MKANGAPIALAMMLLVTAFTGCGAEEEERLGGEGEQCFSDVDCRDVFICANDTCVESGLMVETSNGTTSTPRMPSCETVCERLVECLGSASQANCESDCDRQTASWTDGEYETFTDCVLDFTCVQISQGDLDSCVP